MDYPGTYGDQAPSRSLASWWGKAPLTPPNLPQHRSRAYVMVAWAAVPVTTSSRSRRHHTKPHTEIRETYRAASQASSEIFAAGSSSVATTTVLASAALGTPG